MKAVLMSIRPRHDKNILNGFKTLEIRKKFPKDYVGWVYIYNTKSTKDGVLKLAYIGGKLEFILSYDKTSKYQGKVVGRFWCDKVEEIDHWYSMLPCFNQTCLSSSEFVDYVGSDIAYALSITKLEIFDKPKELKEFFVYSHSVSGVGMDGKDKTFEVLKPLTKAPQSWCYIRDVL